MIPSRAAALAPDSFSRLGLWIRERPGPLEADPSPRRIRSLTFRTTTAPGPLTPPSTDDDAITTQQARRAPRSTKCRRQRRCDRAALAHVRTGTVARAARDDGEGRFTVGDAVGFVDDAIVAWGEPGRGARAARRAR